MKGVIRVEVVEEWLEEVGPDIWGLTCARGGGDDDVQEGGLPLRGKVLPPGVRCGSMGG